MKIREPLIARTKTRKENKSGKQEQNSSRRRRKVPTSLSQDLAREGSHVRRCYVCPHCRYRWAVVGGGAGEWWWLVGENEKVGSREKGVLFDLQNETEGGRVPFWIWEKKKRKRGGAKQCSFM